MSKRRWADKLLFLLLSAVGLSLTNGVQAATTWMVCKEGGCNFTGIQAAIDAPATIDQDTVLVSGGTYVENIDFAGKAITVRSKYGAANTTIDGGYKGSVVTFSRGEGTGSILDGLTITKGRGADAWSYAWDKSGYAGGGIYCENSSPTITNCSINGNQVVGSYGDCEACGAEFAYGGGIYCINSALVITNCTITNNLAYGGDGAFGYTAQSGGEGAGGGLYCSNSSPTISGCVIKDNRAFGGSGGTGYLYCEEGGYGGDGGNAYGGGIAFELSSAAITNCFISRNRASAGNGGKIYGDADSDYCRYDANGGHGGSGYGGGIYCSDSLTSLVSNCTINGNSVYGGLGGDGAYNGHDGSNGLSYGQEEYCIHGSAIAVKGNGYYTMPYSGIGYRTQVSVNICSEAFPQWVLNYYNSKTRVTFTGTSIQSVSSPSAGVAVIIGKGTVNKKAGYSFKTTITDSSNRWEMIIYNSWGDVYEAASGYLNRGDLVVSASEACGF